ncbi:conjugative transposon protein TraK [Rufibacter sediminis]|uniref:Conjugative transposon protein TraK n=1 Tax=Rufibacter sediminis TaxID=2762756 RepID=A0ABR6VQ44_9BACT|nr:conjugative transposon protein TraK [Rufibacter sediminis]MBC3538973.1 conjugative transposon protein TraK [Rufibacter sediminis]
MQFKSLSNLETSFKQMRLFLLIFIGLTFCLSAYVVYMSFSFAKKSREKIYVLDNGKSLMLAISQDMKQNRPVEARDHVKRFHELFFTLAPDQKAIEYTINQALYLCDESAQDEYANLKEAGYFSSLIAGNVSQEIRIDSVLTDFNEYPYTARCYATQTIIRSTSETKRSLVSQCQLRDVSRSDDNPHGFLMEKWRVLENRDLQVTAR